MAAGSKPNTRGSWVGLGLIPSVVCTLLILTSQAGTAAGSAVGAGRRDLNQLPHHGVNHNVVLQEGGICSDPMLPAGPPLGPLYTLLFGQPAKSGPHTNHTLMSNSANCHVLVLLISVLEIRISLVPEADMLSKESCHLLLLLLGKPAPIIINVQVINDWLFLDWLFSDWLLLGWPFLY